jgi:signal transduction histidine kinase
VPSMAQLKERYTSEHPVRVVTNLNLPPYEFNDHNSPSGYCVDLIKTLMQRIGLPYVITMEEGYQQAYWFEHNEADLIITLSQEINDSAYFVSRCIIDYFKLRIAHHKDAPEIESPEQMRFHQPFFLSNHDLIAQRILSENKANSAFKMTTPREALNSIARDSTNYFLWGEEALKWAIRGMQLEDSIKLSDFSFKAGELHFVCHDKELVDAIDNSYALLDQSGDVLTMHNKWFHPEKSHQSLPITVSLTTVLIICFISVLLYLNRKLRQKEEKASRNAHELSQMMRLALEQTNYAVMEYDLDTGRVVNTHGNMLPDNGCDFDFLSRHIHPDNMQEVSDMIEKLKTEQETICEVNFKWLPIDSQEGETDSWLYLHGHLLAEKDSTDHVRYLVAAIKDVTKEHEEEEHRIELTDRFVKIFDATLVAMAFYDKDGYLMGLNKKMRELTGYDNESETDFYHTTRLFDAPMFKGEFDPASPQHLYACQHMVYPEQNIDRYIEFRILPTYQENELLYYVVTVREITAEREMYMKLCQKDAELRLTNERRMQYEKELRYLLENSEMWVWKSNLAERTIHFSRTLQKSEFVETFQQFADSIFEDQRDSAMNIFNQMKGADTNLNTTLHFKYSPVKDTPQWISISGIPLHDDQGNFIGHFGMCRDVTQLMEAQQKLRLETSRAEDSGKLKSVFLANMTHEIRTPLNAIVGFSDLLQLIDNPEERREFMRIIRNNCDMLIRLINDIIEASNMNQGPLSIEADDVDFAIAFNDVCQTLAQRVQEPGVEFIVDNPYQSFLTCVDKGRLQQVITNFTTNAVKYTHQGHIKVGYRYEQNTRSDDNQPANGIYMYCEDTGAGIPKDKQAAVFERFVKLNDYIQGTGLGLSICKSIADRCGGRIGVDSQGEGQGSTFWIWIPCERKL